MGRLKVVFLVNVFLRPGLELEAGREEVCARTVAVALARPAVRAAICSERTVHRPKLLKIMFPSPPTASAVLLRLSLRIGRFIGNAPAMPHAMRLTKAASVIN